MAMYFLLGLVIGIILGTFLAELMRGLVTILLRNRTKRSVETLLATYKDGIAQLGSDYYRPLDISMQERKPN